MSRFAWYLGENVMLARVLVLAWLPDGVLPQLVARFPDFEWLDGRPPEGLEQPLPPADIAYGLPPLDRLDTAARLRWIQLISAGVPQELCPRALARQITVTNLTGLYG